MNKIIRSLPGPQSAPRRKLLPHVLQEWSRTHFQQRLTWEPRSMRNKRIKKIEDIKQRAQRLLEALNAMGDENGLIVGRMLMADGRRLDDVSRAEFAGRIARLEEERQFLANLAAMPSAERFGSGQPRKIRAYLVLQDAAAIFEWFSGKEATRQVDRSDGRECGPFFGFVSVLWPVFFGSTDGLPSAMKNWAELRKQHNERSALVADIDLRHPIWGIFER